MLGKWAVPVLVVAMLAVACSGNKSLLNEKDPFDDPFFHDGLGNGTHALDEIMREPAPSVGWLASDGTVQSKHSTRGPNAAGATSGPDGEGVLLEAEGDGSYVPNPGAEEEEDGEMVASGQKSFYDQASEATMATMSVLFGAGMAALPFLIGT